MKIVNFKTGTFSITNQSGETTFSVDSGGNIYYKGDINSTLSYNSVKFVEGNFSISLSRDHYSVYVLSGGMAGSEQIITLPSPSTCLGLELTFFYENRAHTRSWGGTYLHGTIFDPTEDNYRNTITDLYVELFKIVKIISVGNGWVVQKS